MTYDRTSEVAELQELNQILKKDSRSADSLIS